MGWMFAWHLIPFYVHKHKSSPYNNLNAYIHNASARTGSRQKPFVFANRKYYTHTEYLLRERLKERERERVSEQPYPQTKRRRRHLRCHEPRLFQSSQRAAAASRTQNPPSRYQTPNKWGAHIECGRGVTLLTQCSDRSKDIIII